MRTWERAERREEEYERLEKHLVPCLFNEDTRGG
jgi:hypothetical protein